MPNRIKQRANRLIEHNVRTDTTFCCLLYDPNDKVLRVVDFRGGNFQQKQEYFLRIQRAEKFRKIFTLIERDDMAGWQRVGYQKEGIIPGYYRRSDAYVMGWLADPDWHPSDGEDESEERAATLAAIRELATTYEKSKGSNLRGEIVTPEEVPEIIDREEERRSKGKKQRKTSRVLVPSEEMPLFPQFGRDVEYFYYHVFNRRTKQSNLLVAECQDCFGNAKINLYFSDIATRSDAALARFGLQQFVEWLRSIGYVAIFSMVDVDQTPLNAVFASAGFKHSGWLQQQVLRDGNPTDQLLWTMKFPV